MARARLQAIGVGQRGHVVVDAAQHAGVGRAPQRRRVVGVALDDVVAQGTEVGGQRVDRGALLAPERVLRAGRGLDAHGDAQPPGAARDRAGEVVARCGGVHEQRGVGRAARERAADRQSLPGAVVRARAARGRGGGLSPTSPHHAAGPRIDPAPSEPSATPQSPAATAAPRAPARAARGAREVPRIAGGAERRRVGRRQHHQLGRERLADDDRARGTQAAHDLGVLFLDRAVGRGAPGRDLPGDVDVVLDRDGHPEQRALVAGAAAGVGLVGLDPRALGEHDRERVDARLERLDAREGRVDELAGRDVARGDEAGLLGGAGETEVGGVHGAQPI